ncbi:MAG: NAD-dependent epimerase/dehydratase family protein [Bacteriovoracia bacterium]
MKILVTGALGHIGSRVIRELPARFPGMELTLIDDMSAQRYCSLFNLPEGVRYRFTEGDVTKIDLGPLVKGADFVLHLAAITNAAGSFENQAEVERNNFYGTQRVADECVRQRVPLLYLSSTSVYGSAAELVDEDCPESDLNPQSPYAETKLKEERLLAELGKKAELPFIVCRFGTIFGISPGIRFHTAVNKFCWQAVTGKPLTVWKTAYDQKRPYLDVGDAVNAIELILRERIFDRRIYNVLTGNYTVRQITDVIRGFVPDLTINFVETQIMNQLSYEVSCARFQAKGFRAQGDIHRGISDTVDLLRGLRA